MGLLVIKGHEVDYCSYNKDAKTEAPRGMYLHRVWCRTFRCGGYVKVTWQEEPPSLSGTCCNSDVRQVLKSRNNPLGESPTHAQLPDRTP